MNKNKLYETSRNKFLDGHQDSKLVKNLDGLTKLGFSPLIKINKRGLEFGFAWLFAIIVGAVILFIAIFATTNLIQTSRVESDTKVAAQLGILLNPLETNVEEAKYAFVEFPDETQVHNRCRESGPFGRQIIATSVRSSIGEEFQEPGIEVSFFNKYMFSKNVEQGEELNLLVKPLEMPYKIGDLVISYTGDYCFVNAPTDIENEITSLSPRDINLSNSIESCPEESQLVCFGTYQEGCDIQVKLSTKSVVKNQQEVYYFDSLVYGAIFSDPGIYECQVKRLMKRSGELAQLYATKSDFLSGRGCSGNLGTELRSYSTNIQIGEDESSLKLISNAFLSDEIDQRNGDLGRVSRCKLF